jgi:glycosyltransferase involved in cell wall biosynthesis
MTLSEVEQARGSVLAKTLSMPIRLVFAGRTATSKGLGVAIQVVHRLAHGGDGRKGIQLTFDIMGDGPERPRFEELCHRLGLDKVVRFHGWVAQEQVCEALKDAHMILLPSQSEGWPKVLSEAMAYGVVPISSHVSAIPQVLDEVGSGTALGPEDVSGYVRAIREVADRPDLWREMLEAGLRAAPRFTYERYLIRLDEMLAAVYGEPCFDPGVISRLRAQWVAALGAEGIDR